MYSMLDSNLITNPKAAKRLTKENVEEMAAKFMLDKSETEAEKFFTVKIQDSVSAILTRVWDEVHKFLNN